MNHFFGQIWNLLKFPLLAVVKTIVFLLNLIPLPIYEVHGLKGTSDSNRPDLREFHIKMKGHRKAHLGTAIIAHTRGAIFRADINTHGKRCWGIYSEDYQDIQKRWGW